MVSDARPSAPVWRSANGRAVSCLEKIKVLDQNIAEISQLCADAMEGAILMGCDAQQVRDVLHDLVGRLEQPFGRK